MILRESGMPDEAYWETLFDVPLILERLGIDSSVHDVVELGCGYGTFTIPVAAHITGTLRTFDIDPRMVDRTRTRVVKSGLSNVECSVRDVFERGFGVDPRSADVALLFNILHCDEPDRIISDAKRVLRPGGRVLAIHWRHDPSTPRGPTLSIRPRPEQIAQWMQAASLSIRGREAIDLPPYHYGIISEKAE